MNSQSTPRGLRWNLLKALSWLAWCICPEPHKSNLQMVWHAQMGQFTTAIDYAKREGILPKPEKSN